MVSKATAIKIIWTAAVQCSVTRVNEKVLAVRKPLGCKFCLLYNQMLSAEFSFRKSAWVDCIGQNQL